MITHNNNWETMMNEHKIKNSRLCLYRGKQLVVALGVVLFTAAPLQAEEPLKLAAATNLVESAAISSKSASHIPQTNELPTYVELSVGQLYSIKLPERIKLQKVSIDNPNIVQVSVTGLSEILLQGKSAGSAVLILKDKSGQASVVELTVLGGTASVLQSKLKQLLPGETIRVVAVGDSLVLTGSVADAVMVNRAVMVAEAYSGKKVINFLQAGAPQQVMLEVRVAEVSKTLTDKLGSFFKYGNELGSGASAWSNSLLANFLSGANGAVGPASITAKSADGLKSLTLDAAKTSGLVKILAEPTIMAMSGQEGAFLAGGKIYIPVAQSNTLGGASVVTMEEKEFGVGLKFTPTVLEDGLINLKVAPEVSEIGSGVTFGTQTLPSIMTRRATTTVQLKDGQSFAIGGLIKNNVKTGISAFPGLGEIPVLGALFRSSEFQNDRTELLFVVTPRLVKPLPPNYALPTDSYIAPNRAELFLNGRMEGSPKEESKDETKGKTKDESKIEAKPKAAVAVPVKEQPPAQTQDAGGFQMK